MTGDNWESRIRRCPGALRRVIAEHGLLKAPASGPRVAIKPRLRWLDDDGVLAAIKVNDPREHRALFVWHADEHADRSQLDFRLAALLTRYVGNDPERIERLMRLSPLDRDKWQRRDYMDRTIQRAIQVTDSFVIVRRKGAA